MYYCKKHSNTLEIYIKYFCSMKKLYLAVIVLLILSSNLISQSTIREYNKVFTTYPFSDPNPIPSAGRIYPYFRFDGFASNSVQKEWKVVELENEYIKVMILPEIGGKVWAAIEKSTNNQFIYYNEVVKFRDIAMRGAWTSGGIEANYGIIGHAPSCSTPIDYTTFTNNDGSVSCIIGSLDLLTMSNWRLEINLPKDKAYFSTNSFWHNSSNLDEPYYNWMNAGIKAKGNLELIYPGTNYIEHSGELEDWPINKQNGKTISFYEDNNFGSSKSYHVLGKYSNYYGGYWHDDNFGMICFSNHEEKAGKKAWIWGLSRAGMIWEDLLTDNNGQYVEVQSGRLHNQNDEKSTYSPFKHRNFTPYTTDKWTEYWYPIMKIGGVVEANEYGALNIKYENGWLKILFSPVQTFTDKLIVKNNENIIYDKTINFKTLKVFSDSIKINLNPQQIVAILGENKLKYNSDPVINNLNRPLEAPSDFDWNSEYGLYVLGKDLMDQRIYTRAEEKLTATLEKDHNYLPALVKMAELKYRNALYTKALEYAVRALSIDTYNGGANYYYGLINSKLGKLTDAKDGFDFASHIVEYKNAALTELAKIYILENNPYRAHEIALKSLEFNINNLTAYSLLATTYRIMNEPAKAKQVIEKLETLDPLNHLARFENYLLQPTNENMTRFASNIKTELPNEIYLDITAYYYNIGLYDNAKEILQISPENPQNIYWMAFLLDKQGKNSQDLLEKANALSPAFVFPFRTEMIDVLKWTIEKSKSWKSKYYLALLYNNLKRTEEAKDLLSSCEMVPDFAPFYATRSTLWDKTDKEQILKDIIKAGEIENNEWRYKKILAELYIQWQNYDKALATLEPFYKSNPDNYIIGMVYAKSLLLNQKFNECDALLDTLVILPFEGRNEGHDYYSETKLMLALNEFKKGSYKNTLKLISLSREWPENLGVGKPYQDLIDERLEDWISYKSYEKMKKTKDMNLMLQKIMKFSENGASNARNIKIANTFVSLWTIEKLKSKPEAVKWLDKLISQNPTNNILKWCRESYVENKKSDFTSTDLDGSLRMFKHLEMIN